MAYTITFNAITYRAGVPSTEACVLVHAAVAPLLAPYRYGKYRGGGIFDLYPSVGYDDILLSLSLETLASAAVGVPVFIGAPDGTWQIGTVASDGSTVVSPTGGSIPATATAATFLTENRQVPPAIGEPMKLVGSASDGKQWLADSGGRLYVAAAATTAGALMGTGTVAAVQSDNTWFVVRL